MSTTIESLELEVLSSSQSAESGLDALTASLEKLKKATSGGVGLTSVIKQIKGLGDAAKSVSYSQLKTKFAGYKPYYMYRQKNATGTDSDSRENIGYSKRGKECIYNILIMEEKQTILALGAGASSKFLLPSGKKLIERVENVKNVDEYINRIDEMIERKRTGLGGNV